MKKIIIYAMIGFLLLSGCMKAKKFSNEQVISKAEEVIRIVNEKDLTKLKKVGDAGFRARMNEDLEKKILYLLISKGNFENVEDIKIANTSNSKLNKNNYVIIAKVRHSNGNVFYFINFNEKLRLSGIAFK